MMKGHTKIELTNVKTGEKRVVEDDNLVTNAINKYFENPFNTQYYFNAIQNPLLDSYFGGLLLFQNPIEEKADNYHLPSGNPMIGNGIVNYSSNDIPEFGSFNGEESTYKIENGIATRKYVYDFTTSKGNGTISAVCLTNLLMGYYGAGNHSEKCESKSANNIDYSSWDNISNRFRCYYVNTFVNNIIFSSDIAKPQYDLDFVFAFNLEKNCAYLTSRFVFENSGYSNLYFKTAQYIEIYKVYFPFNKLNLNMGIENYSTVYDKIQLEIPNEIKNCNFVNIAQSNDAFYFIGANSSYIKPNETFYIWKLTNNFQASEIFTLTNLTNSNLAFDSSIAYNHYFGIVRDFLVCSTSSDDKLFKFNLKKPTEVTELQYVRDEKTSYSYPDIIYPDGENNLIAVFSGSQNISYKIDLERNILEKLNGLVVPSASNYWTQYNCLHIPMNSKDYYIVNGSGRTPLLSASYYLIRNPFTLSTINNLPEPVTKTSDMTMKITYTLTSKIEPDEEG